MMEESSVLMSIKVGKINFVKIFSLHSNKTLDSSRRKSKKRLLFIMGFVVLALVILSSSVFTANQLVGSKTYEFTKTLDDFSNKNSQKNQNVERFGDAFSINPDQLQPEVLEPILENYDNIPKP